jgi:DNA replication protein DnaC
VQGLDGNGGKQHDAGIPSEYKQTTLETSRSKEAQSNVYRNLEEYVKTFKKAFNVKRNDKENRLKDLFFYSKETGTGKTESSCALANEFLHYSYIRSVMLEDPNSFYRPVYFIDMPKLQSLYLKANRGGTPQDIREESSSEYYLMLLKAKKARLCIFDEMALRDVSEAFRGDIHELINHRTVENLTSIYTSNVPLKEMLDIYDQRLYDRIRRYTVEFNFVGESQRGKM